MVSRKRTAPVDHVGIGMSWQNVKECLRCILFPFKVTIQQFKHLPIKSDDTGTLCPSSISYHIHRITPPTPTSIDTDDIEHTSHP